MNSVRSFQIPFRILNLYHEEWKNFKSDVSINKDKGPGNSPESAAMRDASRSMKNELLKF